MKGAGYEPQVLAFEVTKNGSKFVNVKVQVGDLYVKFDPAYIDSVINALTILRPGLLRRREELVNESREKYETDSAFYTSTGEENY
jgi:hypothetical protein